MPDVGPGGAGHGAGHGVGGSGGAGSASAPSGVSVLSAPGKALCVGEMVSFFVEDYNGFLSADGFTEDSINVLCLRENEICVPRFESCVFQVQIKQSYHAKVELEAFMERHGIVDANRANDVLNVDQQEEYARLCSEVKHEQKRNAEDMQIYFGREVPHSMPVQLLHVKSQKYLKVCLDNAADAEGSNISVVLTKLGAASCFLFRSRHGLKLAFDPVCNLDAVFLVPEDLADSHFLNCDIDVRKMMNDPNPKLKHRVSALLTGMTLLVQKYRMGEQRLDAVVDNSQQSMLRCGQVVRLYNSMMDVFLSTTASMTSSRSLVVLEDGNGFDTPGAATRLEQPSAYSMWIVEHADPTKGCPVLFDEPIRLRNMATGSYLCPNKMNDALIAKGIPSWAKGGSSERAMASSICSFCRLSENKSDDGQISKKSVVWINFPNSFFWPPEEDTEGRWVKIVGTSSSSLTVQLSKELGPTDGFVVFPVDDADLIAPFQIVSVAHTIRDYMELIKKAGFTSATAVKTEEIIKTLKDFVKIFDHIYKIQPGGTEASSRLNEQQQDGEINKFKREIFTSQSIVRELQLMDNLVELVDFRNWERIHKEKHSIKELRHSPDMSLARGLCKIVFQILSLATRGNDRNGVHLSQFIESLLYHYTGLKEPATAIAGKIDVSYLSSLQQCVIDIYHDNGLVLSGMDKAKVSLFANLLFEQHQLTPTYLHFLNVIIQFKQKCVVQTVKTLCDFLLDGPGQRSVPRTMLRGDDILVEMPNLGGVATCVPVEDALRDPLQADYYNEFIHLASIMCRGRSKTNEGIMMRLIDAKVMTMDLCVAFLTREGIPLRTRAVYTELLSQAFIDCSPQAECCNIDYIHVWPDLYADPVRVNVPFSIKFGGIMVPLKIKDNVLSYLDATDIQGLDPERDEYDLSVMKLLSNLVLFGFFSHTVEWVFNHEFIYMFPRFRSQMESLIGYLAESQGLKSDGGLEKKTFEVEILVQPLMLMLDPSTDYKEAGKRPSQTLINCKTTICKILDLICNIRLRIRVNRLLQVYDTDLQNGLVHSTKLQKGLVLDAKRLKFEKVLEIIKFEQKDLTKMLTDLLQYGDEVLNNSALNLLLRVFWQRHELLETLCQSDLLVNSDVISTFNGHKRITKSLEEFALTFGLIVSEFIVSEEEKRIEEHLCKQQKMLEEEEEDERREQTDTKESIFGGLASIGEGISNLFGQAKPPPKATHGMSISMMARMSRRINDSEGGDKKALSKKRKKVEQKDEKMQMLEQYLHREKLDADRHLDMVMEDNCTEICRLLLKLVHDFADISKLSVRKIQVGLRDLQLHVSILDIIRAICQDSTNKDALLKDKEADALGKPQLSPVFLLLKEVFNLMTHYCKNNSRNAEYFVPEFNILFKFFEHRRALELGIDEVLASMYNNNRGLCTQPQKLEKKVMSLICGPNGKRFPYLKLLSAVMCPNGLAIKKNQTRIVKMLEIQKDKTLNLFVGEQGLVMLRSMLRRKEYLDPGQAHILQSKQANKKSDANAARNGGGDTELHADEIGKMDVLYDPVHNVNKQYDSEVMYYLYSLKLFTQATFGSNHITEKICCSLIPIQRCAEIITASWCISEIKIAMIEFLTEAHLLGANIQVKQSHLAVHDENFWVINDYFATMLLRIMDPLDPKAYCLPKEGTATTRKITMLLLNACKVFFNLFRIKTASEQELNIANRLCDAIVKYLSEHTKVAKEKHALADLLYVMRRNGIQGGDLSMRLAPSLLDADRIDLNASDKNDIRQSKEIDLFPSFLATFETRIQAGKEMQELMEVCIANPKCIQVITGQLTSVHVPMHRKHVYIDILKELWQTLTNKNSNILHSIEMIRLDTVISATLQLFSKGIEVKCCMDLASSLLAKGGKPVQERFLAYLSRRGIAESTFRELTACIEIASEETQECQALVAQVAMNLKPDKNVKRTLEELVAIYKSAEDGITSKAKEERDPMSALSHIQEVMLFLKNLCEGHYIQMQNLMQNQEQDHSVDLVAALAALLSEETEEVTPMNIKMVIQGFDTLTEFMQGPNKVTIASLLKTNIFDAINHIIRNDHTAIENVYYPKEYLNLVRDLKSSAITCVLAMMEASSGNDLSVPLKLMEALDVEAVLNYAKAMHRAWDLNVSKQHEARLNPHDPILASKSAVNIFVGFKCYILLRTLADFESVCDVSNLVTDVLIKRLHDMSNAAIRHYADHVGCLEIARQTKKVSGGVRMTEIIKVYFQVPAICSLITKRMKEEILWSVDRTNDVTRLRDYFSRVDDIYFEMKHQEFLSSNSLTVLIKRTGDIVDSLYFVNVLLLNIMLLMYFRYRIPLETDPDATWLEMQHVSYNGSSGSELLIASVLPSIQLLLEGLMLLTYTISRVPIFVRKKFKEAHNEEDLKDNDGNRIPFDYAAIPRNFRFVFNYLWYLSDDNSFYSGQCFVWRLFTFSLSLAINIWVVTQHAATSDLMLLFYCLLLWEVFPRSKQVGFVLKAVMVGGSQLCALFCMMIVFVYWFGVMGWVAFPDKFQFRKAEIVDGSTVQNSVETGWGNNRAIPLQYVWQGMLMVIDQGVRKNDVGEALDKFNWPFKCPDPGEYGCTPCTESIITYANCIEERLPGSGSPVECTSEPWIQKLEGYLEIALCADIFTSWPEAKLFIRIIYTFLFFVMVSSIGLEIVFGIVIDAFAALREEREETDKDIRYKCFICGIKRDVFDAQVVQADAGKTGFDKHTDDDHNMWMYMYYLIHIGEIEDKTELNGIESYVYEKSKISDVGFFPVGRSMRLDVLGGIPDPQKEAFRQKEESVKGLELQMSQFKNTLHHKLDLMLKRYGLSPNKKTSAVNLQSTVPATQGRLELSTAPALQEVSKRTQISRMYSPFDTFYVPANKAGGTGGDTTRRTGNERSIGLEQPITISF